MTHDFTTAKPSTSLRTLFLAAVFLFGLLSATTLQMFVHPHAAFAGTDTYPAPWAPPTAQDTILDTWKEWNRECTSYAAWMLHSVNGYEMPFNDDAVNWGTDASNRGITVDMTPAVGSIFWSSSSDHVAYVESVSTDGTTITTEDYNSGYPTNPGLWAEHTGVATSSASGYIHFKDMTSGGGSSSTANLITNGGFNANASYWSTTAGANMTQYPGNQNQASYEGAGYLATNSPQSGGSVYQDIPLTISTGNMYCAEAELTSIGSSGASGTLAIWLTGGTAESSSYVFSNLPSAWTPFKTCITATTSHTKIRVQIYDNVGSPTIGIDAVDVHKARDKNGEYNANASYWNTTAGANMTQYPGNQNQASYEGAGYLATNSPQSGGSVYQDIPLTIAAGNMYCLEAEVTSIGSSGASGSLAIWLNGGTNAQESSYYVLSNLPTAWKPFKTCITATVSHTNIRAQIYDNVGSPTIGIDAVDVHRSLVQNGEFNANASHWSATASANMAQYPGNQNQASYEGAGYLSTNSPQSGGSVYQDIPVTIASGNMYCLGAEITSIGSSGGNGTLAIWLTGGSYSESSSYVFANLPQSTWTPFKTCVTATTSHTNIRAQIYDNVGSPTIGIDAVDVH